MDNMGDWEQNRLIRELAQGRELARQLQLHLNVPSSSHETRETLVQGIVSSYEMALTMLNWSNSSVGGGADHQQPAAAQAMSAGVGIESPPLSGSPRSEESDHDQDGSKKRKATPRWTHQVRVNPGTGLEGTLDDGFSWRKYGQKDILGAKYPRGYYRCTHRHVQGCLATKQVQRSDDDPTIFEISYRGRHTCTQATRANPSSFVVPPENQEPNMALLDPQQHGSYQYQQQQQQHPQEALSILRGSLKVVTQDLEIQQEALPSFHHYFASTSNSASKPDQNQVFSPSALMNNSNTFTGSGNYFSSPANFMSPATSAANYFTASPSGIINSLQGVAGGGSSSNNQNFQSSDQPERNEIISATASAANSPTVGVDFPFGNAEFDENFIFDNSGIFSTFHPFQK